MQQIKISVCQINTAIGDFKNNVQKILKFYRQALKKHDPDLVVFPESALSGYPVEDLLFRPDFIDQNNAALKQIQKKLSNVPAIIGCISKEKNQFYNSAVVLNRSKMFLKYDKTLLPNSGVFDEKRYFYAGNKDGIFKIKNTIIGLSICEDLWGKQHSPCIKQASQGAKILINISASPFHLGKQKLRVELLKDISKKTGSAILYVNKIGGQDELVFDGNSLCSNSKAQVFSCGESFKEDLQLCTFELQSKNVEIQNPITLKKEIEIESIYNALILGIQDYIYKTGFKTVILGLSGGIDSALVACLAKDALGSQNVFSVTMPSRYSSLATQNDAAKVAKNLDISFKRLVIEPIFKSYLKTLQVLFKNLPSNLTEENLQSRIRGTLLMALSNKFGHLVLTTGNKAETALGYFTLYGDSAGAFAPLKDLSKARVYALARYINKKNNKEIIPQTTIDRAPTAELRPNQTDQDSLPPYDFVDLIIEHSVEKNWSFNDFKKRGHSPDLLRQTLRKLDLNEYKRRQTPLGIKITDRAFDKDWRMPISHKFKV